MRDPGSIAATTVLICGQWWGSSPWCQDCEADAFSHSKSLWDVWWPFTLLYIDGSSENLNDRATIKAMTFCLQNLFRYASINVRTRFQSRTSDLLSLPLGPIFLTEFSLK